MLRLINSCQSKVSADQYHVIAGSRPLTSQWVFYWIAGSSQVITLGDSEGEHAKTKFQRNLSSDALLTFFRHIPCTIVSWKVLDILRT